MVRGFICFTMFSNDADNDCFCTSTGWILSVLSCDSVQGDNVIWYLESLESGDEVSGWLDSWFAGNCGAEVWWVKGRLWWPGAGKDTDRWLSFSPPWRPVVGDLGDLVP